MSRADVAPERPQPSPPAGGECPRCAHVVRTPGRNTVFLRCARARTDPRFPKYPPQPVLACPGYEPARAPGDR